MSYLRCLCLLRYGGVRHVLCFRFVLCALCCRFLWIVHFWLPHRYFLAFIKEKFEVKALNILFFI
jgi:hypothetical protein